MNCNEVNLPHIRNNQDLSIFTHLSETIELRIYYLLLEVTNLSIDQS
jgi:hypothetical protein